MQVGFIGLGHLGKAIAGRLLDSGHTLTVWNRTPAKAEGMKVAKAATPAAVLAAADIVFLCLFDSNAVRSVLTGEGGLLSGTMSGKTIVDITTNHFKEAPVFHDLCRKAGATYIESPVLGSVVPAQQGNLTIVVSGEKAGYERVKPILENLGKNIFFLEKPGLATKMKLINNLALGGIMATLAEALSLGETAGIEKKEVLDILSVGGGNSLVLNAKKGKLLEGDFSTHFSNALIYKDLQCVMDLAYEQKRSCFTGAMTKELYARTFEMGIGQEDFAAIYKIFKKG